MTGDQFVQVVVVVVGAVVTLGSLWLQLRMKNLEDKVEGLRATLASVHALMLNPAPPPK